MVVQLALVLLAAFGEHGVYHQSLSCKEGQDAVVQDVRRSDGYLLCIQFGQGEEVEGAHRRLQVEPAHSLQRSHVEGVLG